MQKDIVDEMRSLNDRMESHEEFAKTAPFIFASAAIFVSLYSLSALGEHSDYVASNRPIQTIGVGEEKLLSASKNALRLASIANLMLVILLSILAVALFFRLRRSDMVPRVLSTLLARVINAVDRKK